MTVVRELAILGALVGCGDDASEQCRFDLPDRFDSLAAWNCANAREIARRDGQGLIVTQGELDAYLDVYRLAFEPLAPTLGYPPLGGRWWSDVTIETSRPELVTPWSTGRLTTGLVELDRVLSAARITLVDKAPGANLFALRSLTHAVVSRNFATAIDGLGLSGVTAVTDEFHFAEPASEITFEAPPSAGTVPVLFQIGWGDCFVDCDGQHFWRVVVASGQATLVEEWGDAIPPAELAVYRNAVSFEY